MCRLLWSTCRSKTKALATARQLVKDGDTELSKLSKQAAALDEECDRIQMRIDEMEADQPVRILALQIIGRAVVFIPLDYTTVLWKKYVTVGAKVATISMVYGVDDVYTFDVFSPLTSRAHVSSTT